MSTELVRGGDARSSLLAPLTIAAGRQHAAETIMRAWFEGKRECTVRSHRHDLEDFALYLSRALAISPPMNVQTALDRLFKQSAPSAHETSVDETSRRCRNPGSPVRSLDPFCATLPSTDS